VSELDARTPADLAAWSRAWVEERGRPRLTVRREAAGGSTTVTIDPTDPLGRGLAWPQTLELAVGYADRVDRVRIDVAGKKTVTIAGAKGGAPQWVLPSGGGTPSQPGIAPAAQPNLEGTAVGWCEVGTDGQWWINCQNHGPSKAKHWPANNRGPENVACSRKDGANWCRYRVNMSAVQQMHAQRVTPVQEEPPPSDDYPQYQYDDED